MDAMAPPVADFAEYVARRRPALLRTARALTRDEHTAEDLVQSALARVYPSWSRIKDPQAVDAYVRRAMANQLASWWRQPWRTAERTAADLPEPTGSGRSDVWGTSYAPDTPGRPEPDERRLLWELVLALPPRQRAAVALRYYEGLSEQQAARALGCSVGTVKSNTSRGLRTVRERYLEAAS